MTITYRDKDGYSDYIKFLCHWPFSEDLMEFVTKTYGKDRWAIDACSQVGLGAYSARFRSCGDGDQYLWIQITSDGAPDGNWIFRPSRLK